MKLMIMLGFTKARQRNDMIKGFRGENLKKEIKSCYSTPN